MIIFKKVISFVLIWSFLFTPLYAEQKNVKYDLKLDDLILPSEVKNIGKKSGAIFYSSPVKNKMLMPTHFWGAIIKPGMHFIPIDTPLIKGLSMVGGPSTSGDLSDISVIRPRTKAKYDRYYFDLEQGGDDDAHTFVLNPGDIIFVKKDTFYINRGWITSLIGVTVTILSGVLLMRQVRRRP